MWAHMFNQIWTDGNNVKEKMCIHLSKNIFNAYCEYIFKSLIFKNRYTKMIWFFLKKGSLLIKWKYSLVRFNPNLYFSGNKYLLCIPQ